MRNEFQIPAKPWGDKEIKFLMAHEVLLDNKIRAELGLKVKEEVSTAVPQLSPEEIQESLDEMVEHTVTEVTVEMFDAIPEGERPTVGDVVMVSKDHPCLTVVNIGDVPTA